MATGIRKAALCCVGKLATLFCTCVSESDEDDDSKGASVVMF